MTAVLPVAGLSQAFVDALNENFDAIDERLDNAATSSTLVTNNFASSAGSNTLVDTTSNTITATLPASPSEGDEFWFSDFAGTWGTNSFFVDPNGQEFDDPGDGSDPSEPMECSDPARFVITFSRGKYRPS